MGKPNDFVAAFTSTSEATSLTGCTGSPYSCEDEGILQSVEVNLSGEAATSLIEMGYVKLTSKKWGAREVIVAFVGAGIRTAPAFPLPPFKVEDLELPVTTGTKITAEIIHVGAATPVTINAQVILGFER